MKLVACGLSQEEISYVMGCTPLEVSQHYAQEIEHGTAATNALVGAALLKNALKGDTNAQRAWLQFRARWTIPQHVELTGKDGGPIEIAARKKLVSRILDLAAGIKPSEDPVAGSSVN